MKNNKGFAPILIALIVVAVLAVGGVAYYVGKNSNTLPKTTEENNINSSLNTTNNQQVSNNLLFETYKNSKGQYEVSYPSSWYVNVDKDSVAYGSFGIKNVSGDVFLSGGDPSLKEDSSIISIQINYGMNYATIDDFTRDPKFGLSKTEIARRLSNVSSTVFGGKDLRVLKLNNPTNTEEIYSFVYNNKKYDMSFSSGSQSQYNLDYKIFTDFISSFKLN